MIVVGDNDFAVTRHVEVELEVLNTAGNGGAE